MASGQIARGVGVASGAVDPRHLCDGIMTVDCANHYVAGERDERVCGTDDVSYNDFCLYAQARCTTPTVHIAMLGACHAATGTPVTATGPPVTATEGITTDRNTATTPVVTTAAPTIDPIRQVFCATKDTIQCGSDLEPVCGSDKSFYLNKCEFSKALCDDRTLVQKSIAFCQ